MQKKNDSIPRTLHRRIELPANCGATYAHNRQCCCEHSNQNNGKVNEKPKLVQPQFNTLRRACENIEVMQSHTMQVQFKNTGDLTPRSKATIAPKVTQKLNFGVNQTVFKNLIPININDSILLPKQATSIRKKYKKVANKIPAPDLFDFLDPLPPLTHRINEPELRLEFYNEPYNAFDCYRRVFK